jgi:hypothetical protein
VKVKNIHNWVSNSTNKSIGFDIDLAADAYLHLPDGGRRYIGTFEYYDGTIIAAINVTNINATGFNITGFVYSIDFKRAYVETTYGVSRFEASPFLINIIKFGALIAVNDIVLAEGVFIPHNITSFMNIKDFFLGYYDTYIALGLTPHFNKPIRPIKPTNNTNGTDPVPPPPKKNLTMSSFFDRLGSTLYDLHASVFGENIIEKPVQKD